MLFFPIVFLALTTPSTASAASPPVLTLDEAVARAKDAAKNKDSPDALLIEAERVKDADIGLDALRVDVGHRAVDRLFLEEIDKNTDASFSAFDSVGVGATLPLPALSDIVEASAADLRAEAARAKLREDGRDLERAVRRLVVEIASLKRERDLLALALPIAVAREELLAARKEQGAATVVDVDDAGRERLALAADLVGVEDDLQRARDDLVAALDADVDADDDLDARCERAPPPLAGLLEQAQEFDPRAERLHLLDEALAKEELAFVLGYVPWPSRLEALAINRDDGRRDNLRFGLSIDVPIFHFLDADGRALALRREANARERELLDARTRRQLTQAHGALLERQKRVATLALPPPTATPDDPAAAHEIELHRNLAERRRLRAVARCARAAVDVDALVGH